MQLLDGVPEDVRKRLVIGTLITWQHTTCTLCVPRTYNVIDTLHGSILLNEVGECIASVSDDNIRRRASYGEGGDDSVQVLPLAPRRKPSCI